MRNSLAEKYYKPEQGYDLRFFVNALAYMNKDSNAFYYRQKKPKAPWEFWKPDEYENVSLSGFTDEQWKNIDYNNIGVRADQEIWIPSQTFLNQLKGKVSSGSITGGLWAQAVDAANKIWFFLTYYAKSIAKVVKSIEQICQNVNQVLVRLDI